jgi:hypothetical protein
LVIYFRKSQVAPNLSFAVKSSGIDSFYFDPDVDSLFFKISDVFLTSSAGAKSLTFYLVTLTMPKEPSLLLEF